MAIPAGLMMEAKMMTYRKAGDLHDEALREHAVSVALQNEADIAYVAMMNGIVFDRGEEDGLGMHDGMPEEVK